MKWIFLLLISLGALGLVVTDKHDDDCKFWNHLASNLSHIDEFPMPPGTSIFMQCQGGCANITCSGNIKQSVFGFGGSAVDIDFCFGVQLNHCEDPVRMEYYLDLPKQKIFKEGNITHNDTYELPVPGQRQTPLIGQDTKMIVFVEMVPVNQSFIRFGITGKLRVMFGNRPEFPFRRTIFPETLIDIPDCPKDQSILKKFKRPATCTVSPKPVTTQRPTTSPIIVKSKTYNKSCESGTGFCVNKNEMCKSSQRLRRNGICQCLPTAHLSRVTGYCELDNPLPTAIVSTLAPILKTTVAQPHGSKPSKSKDKTKLTPIVIGSVVGVVAILAIGILVIILIGRRRRIVRYRDNQQLLSDDIMDDDDDINVAI